MQVAHMGGVAGGLGSSEMASSRSLQCDCGGGGRKTWAGLDLGWA